MSSEIRALLGLRDNPMQDCGEVNTLLEAHIQQVEMRVSALLQLKPLMATQIPPSMATSNSPT